MIPERFCINCKHIIRGRADKKFCNDRCRGSYNYQLNLAGNTALLRDINRKLKKNHGILKIFSASDRTRIGKRVLVSRGFDFNYHTSIQQNGKRKQYFFCYDMGYGILNEDEVILIKRNNSATANRQ
jgi:hypothetical protein